MINLDDLYANLSAIGLRVTSAKFPAKNDNLDIEQTLILACYSVDRDSKMLSLIISWLSVHGAHLVADKFFKEHERIKVYLGECPWVYAICAYMNYRKDYRFKKGLIRLGRPKFVGDRDQTTLIKMKGAISYLKNLNLMVATSALRLRESDVFSVVELLKNNLQYRNRHLFGANWRSEIITCIQRGAKNPGAIAKSLGLARSRVGVVYSEYMLVKERVKV